MFGLYQWTGGDMFIYIYMKVYMKQVTALDQLIV